MNKDIVIFFQESSKADPVDFGIKRQTYLDLFQRLQDKGANVYVVYGYNRYIGNNTYKSNFKFDNGKLNEHEEFVAPSGVYDRSGRPFFPGVMEHNVLNRWDFKLFINNKWQCYQRFRNYFSETYLLIMLNQIEQYAKLFEQDQRLVLKPVFGMKGQLVESFQAGDLDMMKSYLSAHPDDAFMLQKFIDTSQGVQGIASGVHDIRIVCLNNEIIWNHVRTPGEGNWKANVAGGGNITEFDMDLLPENIKHIALNIAEIFYNIYDDPLFSIDFGVGKDGIPYIFEFNDIIGLPRPDMIGKDRFIDKLTDRLIAY